MYKIIVFLFLFFVGAWFVASYYVNNYTEPQIKQIQDQKLIAIEQKLPRIYNLNLTFTKCVVIVGTSIFIYLFIKTDTLVDSPIIKHCKPKRQPIVVMEIISNQKMPTYKEVRTQ